MPTLGFILSGVSESARLNHPTHRGFRDMQQRHHMLGVDVFIIVD